MRDDTHLKDAAALIERTRAGSTPPIVKAFFDEPTFTASYVVHDPATREAAIVDSVLDFDQPSGRTSNASADAIADYVRAEGLTVAWILETHAHADHLVVDQIGRHADERQVAKTLADGLMRGRRRDEMRETLEGGVVAGYPVIGVKATLHDGSYHDVDSSELAFNLAGILSVKAGIPKANPVILEPVMKVEVSTPEEFMGDIIGDLNARRGRIDAM